MKNHSIIPFLGSASLAALLSILTVLGSSCGEEPSTAGPVERRVRQPVALVCADGGKTVFVANRRSGSLSVIDAATRKVVAESEVGRGLADLATLPDGRQLLAVDQTANELLLINYQDRSIRVIDRLKVSPDPVRLVVSTDGSSCVVASRWSRRLTFVGLARQEPAGKLGLSTTGTLDLPFCPLELASFGGGTKLVVADAFGGRLAVVDTKRRAIESVRSLPAHNIRGLAFAPDGRTLVIAHQVLNRLAQTSFDDVHWGQLIRNHLRVAADRRPVEARLRRRAARRRPAVRPGRRRLRGGRPGRTRLRRSRQPDRRAGGRRRGRDHREPRPRPAADRRGAPADRGGAEP